jgi:hypothetical protein
VADKASLVRVIGRKEATSLGLLVVDDWGVEDNPVFMLDEPTYLSCLRSAKVERPGAEGGKGRASSWPGEGVFGSRKYNEI